MALLYLLFQPNFLWSKSACLLPKDVTLQYSKTLALLMDGFKSVSMPT